LGWLSDTFSGRRFRVSRSSRPEIAPQLRRQTTKLGMLRVSPKAVNSGNRLSQIPPDFQIPR